MKFSATNPKEVRKFFIIFYIVGTIGMVIPFTQEIFIKLIPYSLLLNLAYLVYFHPKQKAEKAVYVFLYLALFGFLIEMIGVSQGWIFGTYTYHDGLGIKFKDTPLLIGINWAILVYCSSGIVAKTKWHWGIQIPMAALLMLVYDIVLEKAAPLMRMWSFEGDTVPFRNYLAWFCIALVFHCIVKLFQLKTDNPLSLTVFGCQFMFLLMVHLLLQ